MARSRVRCRTTWSSRAVTCRSPRRRPCFPVAWQDSDFTCEGCSSSSPQPFFGAGGIQQKRYSLVGAHTWILSSRMLDGVQGQWTNYHFRQHPPGVRPAEDLFDNSTQRTAPLTPVYTFPSLTWGTSANFYTTQLSRQLRDDMTITTGQHTWKFGAGAQSLSIHGDNRTSEGTWTFNRDQFFDPAQISSFVPIPGSVTQFALGALLPLPVYKTRTSCRTAMSRTNGGRSRTSR